MDLKGISFLPVKKNKTNKKQSIINSLRNMFKLKAREVMSYDPIKHLNHFKQVLSQDKKPISFLLSAGCPVSVKVNNLPLIPDVATLTKGINNDLKENKDYIKLIEEVQNSKRNAENIEDILSFVRTMKHISEGGDVRGFNTEQLDSLEILICEHIKKAVGPSLPGNNTPFHQLASWVHAIERDCPIEIFTTNYDLLMEEALEYFNVPYFDGFVGSKNSFFDLRALEEDLIPKHWLKLWKIHGSMNWIQRKDKSVTRNNGEMMIGDKCLIYPSHLKYEQSRKMPYLALLDRLNSFIKKPSSLLITCGYSFRDEHINDVISNALTNNPTSTVIALLFDPLSTYELAIKMAEKKSNLVLWACDEAFIGRTRGNWTLNSKVNSSLDYLYSNNKFLLGDFVKFGEMLSQLTGSDEYLLGANDAK